MGPICTPDIGPLLSHGQQCSIVFYKMVSNQRFDVMFNFQHKSDHIVHISHFSHTGQAPMGPSFSPAIGPLLPHGPARPSRPAWDPRGAHLVLLAGPGDHSFAMLRVLRRKQPKQALGYSYCKLFESISHTQMHYHGAHPGDPRCGASTSVCKHPGTASPSGCC